VGILAYYDRVLVMDSGKVAEYDTALSFFDKFEDSIFRSLCNEAQLGRDDILQIRQEHQKQVVNVSEKDCIRFNLLRQFFGIQDLAP
jgi:ABC-type methionine transport system ATPase subunit